MVTLVASGSVDDYTLSVRSTIVANFASAAGVSASAVSVEVSAASVRIEVSVASASRAAAEAVQQTLAPSLTSAASATALLPAGLTVVATPVVQITSASPASPAEEDDLMPLMAAGAGGALVVTAIVTYLICRRGKKTVMTSPDSIKV